MHQQQQQQTKLIPDDGGETTPEEKSLETEEWIDETIFALNAPLIVWQGYESDAPKDWTEKARMARVLDLARKDHDKGACTDIEVCFYISGYTLEHVPAEDVFQVYMYAFRRAFGDRVADSIDTQRIDKLDYPAKNLYENLKRWIYKQQKNALLAKQRKQEVSKAVEQGHELIKREGTQLRLG
jgi:hypothetical protein